MRPIATTGRHAALIATLTGLAVAACVLVACGLSCFQGGGGLPVPRKGAFRPVNSWFLTYSYPLPPPGLLSAYVLEDGSAELEATGEPVSIVERFHGEIGLYRHALGPAVGGRLRMLVEAAIAEAPIEERVVPAGTPLLAFGVGTGRKVRKVVSFPLSEKLPAGTARFEAEMAAALRELLKHPVRTIRGSAQWDTAAGAPRGKIALKIRIQNSGSETAEIRHPASAKQGERTGLRVALAPETALGQGDWSEQVSVEIVGGEVRDAKNQPPKPVAVLDPGQTLELEVVSQRQAFLSPGRYTGMVRFETGSKKASRKRAIDGMLVVIPPALVVQPPAR